MDTNTLRTFISLLKQKGFDFKASGKIYNPIEFFLEKLVQKELAHSKLIADLLNPNGSHGQGNLFLDSFMASFALPNLSKDCLDLSKTDVRTEYGISTILDNSTGEKVSGRIDILILLKDQNGNKVASLIIENKLNGASFGKDQLRKYKKGVHEDPTCPDKIYIIVLQPEYLNKTDETDTTLISSQVADCIENALASCKRTTVKESLKSYINYLKNLNMNKKALKNANLLIKNITSEEIEQMRAIKEAYEQLPNAYAEQFLKIMEGASNHELCVAKNESYTSYVDIWKPKDSMGNDMSWRWLSIGFYYDSVYFYLVCNRRTDEDVKKYAELAGFEQSSKSGGWTWHKLQNGNTSLNYSENKRLPNFDDIKNQILKLINCLDEADKKFNE